MPKSAGPARSGSGLTERYVYAVTRRLPEDRRTAVRQELRGTIADRIDTLAAGRPDADSTANERLALEELGDPDRLAASYTGHRLQLIGPGLYLAWKRLLKVGLAVAVPSVTTVVAVINAFSGERFGEVLGGALALAINLAIEKAKVGDIDRRAPGAGGRDSLEQGQTRNWPTLDDDRGGR